MDDTFRDVKPVISNDGRVLSSSSSGITVPAVPGTSGIAKVANRLEITSGQRETPGPVMAKNPSPARLPSFRRPRDLTLSATSSMPIMRPTLTSRPRKNFTPNIPTRREKGEKIEESKSTRTPKQRPQDKNTPRDKGRGTFKEKNFVQVKGSLFGEGIASAPVKRGNHSSHFGGGSEGGGSGKESSFIQKPVIHPDAMHNIDKEHEDQKLKELLRDDFIDDPDKFGDSLKQELLPVQLPMINTGKCFNEEKEDNPLIKKGLSKSESGLGAVKVKKELKENGEISDDDTFTANKWMKVAVSKEKGKIPDSKAVQPEKSVSELLTTQHEDLMFFQLPNCLPSHPPDIKHEDKDPKSTNPTDQVTVEKKSQKQYCTLETMPEGQIGTVKVYHSGKAELWLGNHKLDIIKGTQVGFLQDVVGINADEESKTGDLFVMGHIYHKLVCRPDFESIIKKSL